MKTFSFKLACKKARRCLLTGFLLISCASLLHSQQFLKLKDGHQYMVNIVYQTSDTIKFQLLSDMEVTQTLLMDQVDSIGPRSLFANPAWDTTSNLRENRTYQHFKHTMIAGIIFAVSGAPVLIGGIVMVAGTQPAEEYDPFAELNSFAKGTGIVMACIGGGLTLTGIILTASSSAKMKEIKQKLHGFSFDMRYTRDVKGVSLVYRF